MKWLMAVLMGVCTTVYAQPSLMVITGSDKLSEFTVRVLLADVPYALLPVGGADGKLAVAEVARQQTKDRLAILVSMDDTLEPLPPTLVFVQKLVESRVVVVSRRDGGVKNLEDLKALPNPTLMFFGTEKSNAYALAATFLPIVPRLTLIPSSGPTRAGANIYTSVLGGHVDTGMVAEVVLLNNSSTLQQVHVFPKKTYVGVAVAVGTAPSRIAHLRSLLATALSNSDSLQRLKTMGLHPI